MPISVVTVIDVVVFCVPRFKSCAVVQRLRDGPFPKLQFYGRTTCAKVGTKRQNTLQRPRNGSSSATVVRCSGLQIALIVFFDSRRLPGCMTCPNNQYSPRRNMISSVSMRRRLPTIVSSQLECSPCSSTDLEKMRRSSKRTGANFHLNVDSRTSIARWNVLGVFFSPKGNRRNRYMPWCDIKVVLSFS